MAIKAAVIGGGLAGLSCARTLHDAGWDVEVFEAEEQIGGRIASMRIGTASFDHGAPYVVPRNAGFAGYLGGIAKRGYVAEWHPRGAGEDASSGRLPTWYVGAPAMNALVRPLVEGLRVHTKHPVHTIKRTGKTWSVWLEDQMSTGPFAAVALAVPAPVAVNLLGGLSVFESGLTSVRMAPCWSLQVVLDRQILGERDIHGELSGAVRWVARNNSKPRRQPEPECLVIQAAQDWSRSFEDEDPEYVAAELWRECCRLLGVPEAIQPVAQLAYLWKYGFATRPLGEGYMYSTELKLGCAGDWCRGRLAEHAYASGAGLGKAMINSM